MTIGQLIDRLSRYPKDFEIKAQVIREIPEEELKGMSYPYPYEYIESELDIIDRSYSDKTISIGMNI